MPALPDPIADFFDISPQPMISNRKIARKLLNEEIILPGMIAMKKNTSVKYGIRSKAYQRWAHTAGAVLGHYGHVIPIDEPVNMQVRFYVNTRRKFDLSNALSGPEDILVAAGVLADDNYTIITSLNGCGVEYDKENPRTVILLTSKHP